MPSKTADRRPYVTTALVTSGAILASSGLAMLSWPAAPLIGNGWSLLGVSGKGIGTVTRWRRSASTAAMPRPCRRRRLG
jgi:hypothetical protein